MKKVIILLCLSVFFVTGCVHQAKLRPGKHINEIWICEEPYAELDWSETESPVGKIIYNDIEYAVAYSADYGAGMRIYTQEILSIRSWDEKQKYKLLAGKANYGKESFTFTVEEDCNNIFDGDLPVMKFVRYNKDEYFKEKEKSE